LKKTSRHEIYPSTGVSNDSSYIDNDYVVVYQRGAKHSRRRFMMDYVYGVEMKNTFVNSEALFVCKRQSFVSGFDMDIY
jgi:hypothetical protein